MSYRTGQNRGSGLIGVVLGSGTGKRLTRRSALLNGRVPDREAIAGTAVDLLAGLLAGPDPDRRPQEVCASHTLIARESTLGFQAQSDAGSSSTDRTVASAAPSNGPRRPSSDTVSA